MRALLTALVVVPLLAGCGDSKAEEPISVGSTIAVMPTQPRCAEHYTIDGTIVSVAGTRLRVDVEDADGSGEGRIGTVAIVQLRPGARLRLHLRAGRRFRAAVRDCGSTLVAERVLR